MKKVSLLVLSGALLMGSAMAVNFYSDNNEALRPQYQARQGSYMSSSRPSVLQQQPEAASRTAALANVAERKESPAEQQARRLAQQRGLEEERANAISEQNLMPSTADYYSAAAE